MRKLVIIISIMLLIIPRARSQDDDYSTSSNGGLTYGVKIGLVSSTFAQEGQKLETSESRTGFSIGGYGTYQINDLIGVSIEALYVQEGAMRIDPNYIYYKKGLNSDGYNLIWTDYGQDFSIRRVNSNVVMHNFEFPVLVNVSIPEAGDLKPKVFIGGSFDYIYRVHTKNLLSVISSNYGYTRPAYVLADRYFENVTSSFAYYNISGILGMGVEYDAFSLDIRYKFGFKKINNLASFNLQNQYLNNFTSNALMINLGINIQKILNL